MTEDLCEIVGCNRPASRITTTETRYVSVCNDCYSKKYKV
jgi:hypothetical protein